MKGTLIAAVMGGVVLLFSLGMQLWARIVRHELRRASHPKKTVTPKTDRSV